MEEVICFSEKNNLAPAGTVNIALLFQTDKFYVLSEESNPRMTAVAAFVMIRSSAFHPKIIL